jgi:hypothetical protein
MNAAVSGHIRRLPAESKPRPAKSDAGPISRAKTMRFPCEIRAIRRARTEAFRSAP